MLCLFLVKRVQIALTPVYECSVIAVSAMLISKDAIGAMLFSALAFRSAPV